MNKQSGHSSRKHLSASHFDQRAASYDQAEVHRRVVTILVAGADIRRGFRVLGIATGTGLLALEAARQAGPAGSVLGVDVSEKMLAEASMKAAAAGLRNVDFAIADAERLDLPRTGFDRIVRAPALVLMSDVRHAVHHWSGFPEPGGLIAFDTPAKPFGLSGLMAEVAARHGVHPSYADVADTVGKCRSLLEGAGFEVAAIRTELADTAPVELARRSRSGTTASAILLGRL